MPNMPKQSRPRLFTSGANVIRDPARETSAPKYITLEFEKAPKCQKVG